MISSQPFPAAAHLTSSPSASPILRPVAGTLPDDDHSPRTPRSATRAAYTPARLARSSSRTRGEVDAPTRSFAQEIADCVRARKARAAVLGISPASPGGKERDHLEFIVDIPVWSPGCFSDLSTLHALRDTTLAHVHALLAHLVSEHALHGTYRLLARPPAAVGWAGIRLAPSPLDIDIETGAIPLPVRRTSFVKPERDGSGGVASPKATAMSISPAAAGFFDHDHAIADSDSESGSVIDVPLTPGYRNDTPLAEEPGHDDEDSTDDAVQAEVARRGGKEGMVFVAKLKGQLSLILT